MMFRSALAFFTRLPVGGAPLPETFAGVMSWFPVVGIVIGTLVAVAGLVFFRLGMPPAICGLVACMAWVFVTGGLHLDGVADCGDGLAVSASRERRLEIMKDPRLGSFGAMSLFFVLAVKACCCMLLFEKFESCLGFWELLNLIWLVAGISRCCAVFTMRLPLARPGGLADMMRQGMGRRDYAVATTCAFFLVVLNGAAGFFCLLGAACVSCWLLRLACRHLGGITGDVSGCQVELVECACLMIVSI